MMHLARLPERGVLEVAGADRVGFLQGLVSNDVAEAAPGRAVWAALLTPQGKWLADFFVLSDGARLLLDCERGQIAMLLQRLGRFRLRAAVTLTDVSDTLGAYAAWDGAPPLPAGAVAAPDPRLAEAGWRILTPSGTDDTGTSSSSWPDLIRPSAERGNAERADPDGRIKSGHDEYIAWDRHRLALGLPDGSRDLEAEKSVLLEAGFDELGGVSWTKGCYMGQELTARTKYRGLVKRRLLPVTIDGPAPEAGTPVFSGATEIGTMRSSRGDIGLALLRPGALGERVQCGEAVLTPRRPAWMRLPELAEAAS